jgi:hypothetical protein
MCLVSPDYRTVLPLPDFGTSVYGDSSLPTCQVRKKEMDVVATELASRVQMDLGVGPRYTLRISPRYLEKPSILCWWETPGE